MFSAIKISLKTEIHININARYDQNKQIKRNLKMAPHRGQHMISCYQVSEICFYLQRLGEQHVTENIK